MIALAPAIAAALLLAAPPAAAPERLSNLVSPEIVGNAVVFRLRAPRARDVVITGALRVVPIPMERDTAGIWSVRVEGIAPGLHDYAFVVDGVRMADPSNQDRKPARWTPSSFLRIPGSGKLFDEARPGPRGTVHIHEFNSQALGRTRRFHVYTPPGYDRGGTFRLVYLLHGFSDTDATWYEYGQAHTIVDNLTAEDRLRPVVLVMPDGHALPPRPGQVFDEYLRDNAAAFTRDLRDEIIPLVESRYRVARGSDGRVVFGVAMGGHQALVMSIGPAALFKRVAALDPPLLDEIARLATQAPPLQWLTLRVPAGQVAAETLAAALRKRNATVVIRPIAARSELWGGWRKDLADLLPGLLGP